LNETLRLCNSFSELGVLGFGLLVDGNVGIGALPQIQESLVGLPCSGFITHHLLRAPKLEPGQWAGDIAQAQTRIIDQLLELSRCGSAIA
jgi:hypothetical protein